MSDVKVSDIIRRLGLPALFLVVALTFLLQGSPASLLVGICMTISALYFGWRRLKDPHYGEPDWEELAKRNSTTDDTDRRP